MDYLLPTFKTVSVVFAIAALATGAQAIIDPIGFSKSFGMPLSSSLINSRESPKLTDDDNSTAIMHHQRNSMASYISLMGVRQLATGIILLTFASQGKWTEVATILAIIGMVVAGTDGLYLSRAGAWEQGRFHAIPGALIAGLAAGVIYSNA